MSRTDTKRKKAGTMIETYRRLKSERSAGVVDESGFTLIELLIVIVVLGILAAIVVFALGGVTGKSVVAACNSDTKTVDVAAQAFTTENPSSIPATAAAWKADLLPGSSAVGAPFVQSWPQQGVSPIVYTISVAGTAEESVALTGLGASGTPNMGDVIVTIPGVPASVATPDAGTYDATTSPSNACQYA